MENFMTLQYGINEEGVKWSFQPLVVQKVIVSRWVSIFRFYLLNFNK